MSVEIEPTELSFRRTFAVPTRHRVPTAFSAMGP